MSKKQKFDDNRIIHHITTPDGVVQLKIVSPNEFAQHEANKLEDDYCSIVDDNIYISTKAKYDYVLIHYVPTELTQQLKQLQP